MQKEELRNLKRINATPKMIRMAEGNKQKVEYRRKYGGDARGKKMNTRYDLFVRCQSRGPYLMVCIFFPEDIAAGEKTPAYEIYCNPEGNEYITRVLREGKEKRWSVAMADNLDRMPPFMNNIYWYEGMENRIWQNREGMDTIKRFLKTERKGIWGLVEWQMEARRRNTEEAERREQAPWDADMALVPGIFPSFSGWMQKEAAGEHYIFYHYDKRGTDEGYCTHCGRMVPVTKPYYNKEGVCRRCGVTATYKAEGKAGTIWTRWYEGQAIQKIRGGIVVRTFRQRQIYKKGDYRNPEVTMYENARTLVMDNGSVRRYTYQKYKNKYSRFMPEKGFTSWGGTLYECLRQKLYGRNLAALKKTALRNSTVDLWETMPVSTERYLAVEKTYPVIEKLAKVGMFRLAEDLLHNFRVLNGLKNNETELVKILGLDRARLGRLRAAGGGMLHLEWYRYEKLADTIWPDDVIGDLAGSGFHTDEFDFLPPSVRAVTGPVAIRNYLKRQSAAADSSIRQVRNTWADYINMAGKAGMDTKNERIWKPKDLDAAHQEMVMILQHGDMEKEAKKLEKRWGRVNDRLPKLRKYEYTDGKFSIVAPGSIFDIVQEGRILRHCVHTCDFYFDRIERDESYLFFLRRAGHENIPWYTLEVEPNGNIRQKRTTGDAQNSDFDEAVAFLKKWQKVFVKRLTAEEKELGRQADQARLREYAKLREDGNRVWRGKLAGQLLADVLENDFMAAVP
ncbi:MAG: PcfJ domain-containing protein [Ruminococcus flavefaciens]|nr:PcfJ domain-containing protein [Ruminococcus flavefaciens]